MRLPVTGGNTWITLAIAGVCLASGLLLTYRTRKLAPAVVVVLLLGAVGLIAHPRAADASGAPCLPTTTTISGSGIAVPTTVAPTTVPPTTIPATTSTVAPVTEISGIAQSSGYRAGYTSEYNYTLNMWETLAPEVLALSSLPVHLVGAGSDDLFGTADDLARTTTTSGTGTYSFIGLPAGRYEVTVDNIASLIGRYPPSCSGDDISDWTWLPSTRSTTVTATAGTISTADFVASNTTTRFDFCP
jgi:LPXTG-motif cell wall-anchored protein